MYSKVGYIQNMHNDYQANINRPYSKFVYFTIVIVNWILRVYVISVLINDVFILFSFNQDLSLLLQ